MPGPILFFLSTTVSAGAAAYFGAYLKKKAENLATHEDIQQLVAQVKATTEATKAIEGRISDEFWNKQRVWEMKRDLVIALLRNSVRMQEAVVELGASERLLRKHELSSVQQEAAQRNSDEAREKFSTAWYTFEGAQIEAGILCSPEVEATATNFSKIIFEYFQTARDGSELNLLRMAEAMAPCVVLLHDALRRELGLFPRVSGNHS